MDMPNGKSLALTYKTRGCLPTAKADALDWLVFSNGTKSPCWALRTLLGSKVLRHCDCPKRAQKGAEYTQVSPANPVAAGIRKGFYDLYSNYGHYGRLDADGISDWHPSFLQLAATLSGCSKRYQNFCTKYRHHAKGAPRCHWGSRMLKRLVETTRNRRSKSKRVSPGQQQLPFAFDLRLNQIPEEWQKIAVRFRRANGIHDGDRERCVW